MAKPIRIDSNLIQRNSIDTPIVELNNHTLREVFESGNLFDGVVPINVNGIQDLNSSFLHHQYIVNIPSSSARLQFPTLTSLNDYIYMRFEKQSEYQTQTFINSSDITNHTFGNYIPNQRIKYSYVGQHSNDIGLIRIYNPTIGIMLQNEIINYYNMYLINQTSFDISHLTVEQMDYWFNVYQQRKAASLMSENFFSGSLGKGWSLQTTPDNTSNLEVDNLLVRNTLRTHIFQKDVIKATNGQLYVSDSGVVDRVDESTSTIYFKKDKSATFSVNDQLKIKDVNDTGTIQTITLTISSVGAEADGAQAYTYTSAVNIAAVQSGMTAVRVSGGAVLIDASTTNSPFIDVLSNGAVKARLGNLAGIAGASGYGLWSDNVFLTGKIIANSGSIGNWQLVNGKLQDSSVTPKIILDATSGLITLNNTEGFNKGGVYLDKDGKFSLGTDQLNWNGSQLNVNGTIGGEISNISVGSIDISSRLSIDENGIIANNGNETTFSLDSETGNAYFKGHIEAASGTFAGALDAATGSFSGQITADSGSIGGVTIASSKVYTGTGTYNNVNTPFYFDNTGKFSLKNNFSWNGENLLIGDPSGSRFTYNPTNGFKFYGTLSQENLDQTAKDALKGDAGISISSVAQKYAVSSSNSTVPTTWYDTVQTMTPTNKYLWSYQIITYSDTTTSSTSAIVIGVYGEDGQDGATGSDGQDGVSITGVTTHYLASSASTGVTTGTSGWTTTMQTTDTTKKYLWSYQVITYSNSTTTTIPPVIIGTHGDTGPQGPQGLVGSSGYNQAVIYLYKRSSSAPALGTISFTYTFSSASVSSASLNDWTTTVPSGTNPLYVSVASIASQNASMTVTNSVFSTPVLFVQNGATGAAGLNVATVYIYKRGNTAPTDKPTGNTTFTFATGAISFTTANGWLATPPSTGGNNLYVRLATASANSATDTIADTEWSSVSLLSPKGDTGPQGPQGDQGVQGPPGANGESLFTWVKYADDINGTNMSDSPTGKTHIGLAYNKTTATESSTAGDYTWALIKGDQGIPGVPGEDGQSLYTWIKYADTPTTGMNDSPTGKKYLGIAYNKTTPTESTTYGDYSWSLIEGPQGPQGPQGEDGDTGPQGPKGPGLVYRGAYSNGTYYYNESDRVDAVLYNSNYYYYKGVTGTVSSWNAAHWTQMNNFASVATDILLAQNAVVNKGLTLGTSGNPESTAFIRSADKTSLTTGKGFYIENTGKFSFGDSNNYVNWDNSQLSIKGRIGGEISDMTLGELYVSDRLKLTADGIFAEDSLGNETFSLFSNTGNAVFNGTVYAAAGEIGGWSIGSNSLSSSNFSYTSGRYSTAGLQLKDDGSIVSKQFAIEANGDAYFRGNISAATGTISNSIKIGSGESVFKVDSSGIYLGNETFANAEFSVTPAGYLKSTSGKIGGWNIDNNAIYSGTKRASGDTTNAAGLTLGSTGFLSTKEFNITTTGEATFSGTLSAPKGNIGGWILSSTQLSNKANTPTAIFNGDDTNPYLALGKMTYASNDSGAFIGFTGGVPQMSLGNATNYMKWTGSMLDIKGSIGGEISEISVGSISISSRLTIDENGIIANNGTETTFGLDSNTGNAYFKGHIEATSGTFSGSLQAATGSFSGTITAGAGEVGGWSISPTTLSSDNIILDDANNQIKVGTIVLKGHATTPYIGIKAVTYGAEGIFLQDNNGTARFKAYKNDNNYLEWDGSKLLVKAANFTLDSFGNITAANVDLTGTIKATGGTIGSHSTVGNRWQIGSTSIYNGKTSIDNTTAGVYIGIDGISLGTAGVAPQFKVSQDGSLTSTKGKIANWNINDSTIKSNNITLDSTNDRIEIGSSSKIVIQGHTANPFIGIGASSYESNGIFLGNISGTSKFSIVDSNNHLKWDGSNLDIKGNIGGQIGSMALGELVISSNLVINESGIFAENSEGATFSLFAASGNAYFKGHIEATSGTFSGALQAATGSLGSLNIDGSLGFGTSGNITIGKITINKDGITAKNASNVTTFSINQSTGAITASGITISNSQVTGLGSLATQSSVAYGDLTGTKPPTDADSTSTTIANGLITTGTLQVVQGGTVAAGITGNTSGNTAVRFWAGSAFADRANAPFKVTQAGVLTATGAVINGDIGGSIGKIVLTGTGYQKLEINSDGIIAKNASNETTFNLDKAGNLSLKGVINATSGFIGNWTLSGGVLTTGTGTSKVLIGKESTGTHVFYAGGSNASAAQFVINQNGSIKASSGTIGGLNISPTSLSYVQSGYTSIFNSKGISSQGLFGGIKTAAYLSTGALRLGSNTLPSGIDAIAGADGGPDGDLYSMGSLELVSGQLRMSNWGDILLASLDGNIYVQGGGQAITALRNPTGTAWNSGAVTVSSKILKEDIQDLETNSIEDFLNKVNIRTFKYKEDQSLGLSVIIEDELERNENFQDFLYERSDEIALYQKYEHIPDYLKDLVDTDNFEKTEKGYSFRPLIYSMPNMLGLSMAANKNNQRRIEQLEEKNKELEEKINKILKMLEG